MTAITTTFAMPEAATPAEMLFVLAVLGDTSRHMTVPYPVHSAASCAYYRLTELARKRGVRNRTKLNAHGRYGKYTKGARMQFERVTAVLTEEELQQGFAWAVAAARR